MTPCWPVCWVGGGSIHRVPLCCGPLGAWHQPHSAALPSGLHLTLPYFSQEKNNSTKTGQSRLSATHGISLFWGRVCHCLTLLSFLPPPPSLSSLTHQLEDVMVIFSCFLKRLFEFIFSVCFIVIFVYIAVVYKIVAAELALYCSYAETVWAEVPLYVYPVY